MGGRILRDSGSQQLGSCSVARAVSESYQSSVEGGGPDVFYYIVENFVVQCYHISVTLDN